MENKKVLREFLKPANNYVENAEVKIMQYDKKVYITPKLSYEGKWDTVTMQFGLSTGVP